MAIAEVVGSARRRRAARNGAPSPREIAKSRSSSMPEMARSMRPSMYGGRMRRHRAGVGAIAPASRSSCKRVRARRNVKLVIT